MKSERRHELQENQLADWLENAGERMAPHVKTIAFVIAAGLIAMVAYAIWQSRAEGDQQAAWNAFYAATNAEKPEEALLGVADANTDNAAGLWARLTLADSQFADGVQNLFTNRAAALPKLKSAAENYHQVAEKSTGRYQSLVERGLYGEAKAREALGEKDSLDTAEKLYSKLAEDYPDSALAEDAKNRIAALKKPAARGFYDWFVKAEPVAPPTTGIGTPGTGPAFNDANIPAAPTGETVDPKFNPFDAVPPATGESTSPPSATTDPTAPQP